MTIDQRWIIAPVLIPPGIIHPDWPLYVDGCCLIISDYNYWMAHEAELEADLLAMGGSQQGMILCFPDDETRTMWMLRWS